MAIMAAPSTTAKTMIFPTLMEDSAAALINYAVNTMPGFAPAQY